MNEAEWLACTDPEAMLGDLVDKVSARRFRLYHCAVPRQLLWPWLEEFEGQAIEVTERYFDTPTGSGRPAAKRRASKYGREEVAGHHVEKLFFLVSVHSAECLVPLRCIFGNPFHHVTISPTILACNDGVVVRLGQAVYEERLLQGGTLDNVRLAVLADALEQAGCMDMDILANWRSGGEHVQGCWVVDLLLGKSSGQASDLR